MVEAATGDFYVADKIEEPKEFTRVQKFDSEGKVIAQALIKLPAGGEHEVELRALALDAEKHKLYLLVDGERSTNSKHDSSDVAAAGIYSISTEPSGEELEAKPFVEKEVLEPYSEKAKVSLIEPAGIAVDPTNHDVLISAQQDEDKSESEELHSVIQRVHETAPSARATSTARTASTKLSRSLKNPTAANWRATNSRTRSRSPAGAARSWRWKRNSCGRFPSRRTPRKDSKKKK